MYKPWDTAGGSPVFYRASYLRQSMVFFHSVRLFRYHVPEVLHLFFDMPRPPHYYFEGALTYILRLGRTAARSADSLGEFPGLLLEKSLPGCMDSVNAVSEFRDIDVSFQNAFLGPISSSKTVK
jgi:hypothetical protein